MQCYCEYCPGQNAVYKKALENKLKPNPLRKKGPASSSFATLLEDDFKFKVAEDFGRFFKKATEEESVPSSVTEQMRSKSRDLGGIRLQTAQGNTPAAPERDAVIQKRTSE